MALSKTEYIWMNGKLVKWEDAKIHILSHVGHDGSSVFEGMRIYKSAKGPVAFRLREHSERLFNSARIYRMDIPFTPEDIDKDVKEHMDILKPGGRWIAQSSHSIVNYIPHDNFLAMINAIHEYGCY